jgi:hypothetical protein
MRSSSQAPPPRHSRSSLSVRGLARAMRGFSFSYRDTKPALHPAERPEFGQEATPLLRANLNRSRRRAKQINKRQKTKRTAAIVERIGTLRAGHGPKLAYLAVLGAVYLTGLSLSNSSWFDDFSKRSHHVPPDADHKLAICRQLNTAPGPPEDFWSTLESDR